MLHRGLVGKGRQEHERDVQHLAQVGRHVEAAFAFHADVQQRQIGQVLARQQNGVVAVVGIDDVVAGLRQPVGQRGQHQPVIVHHQQPALARHGPRPVTLAAIVADARWPSQARLTTARLPAAGLRGAPLQGIQQREAGRAQADLRHHAVAGCRRIFLQRK